MRPTTRGLAGSLATGVSTILLAASAWAQGPTATPVALRIDSQPLDSALNAWASQTGYSVLVRFEGAAQGKMAPGVSGKYTPEEGLKRLLAKTDLKYEFVGEKTVTVRLAGPEPTAQVGEDGAADSLRPIEMAQAAQDERPQSLKSDSSRSVSTGTDARTESTIAEVIVTAQKREERVQDVPLSMVVRSGEDLKQAGISEVSDLERTVPGLIYSGIGETPLPTIFLRGIGTVTNSSGVDPSVGVVMDGVVSARTSAFSGEFNDVDRVEVLRGPQGTLFGKNSSAGLISIVTRDPTEAPTATFGIGTGSYKEIKVNGTLSGPLIDDTLLGRISFYDNNRGGYLYNIGQNRNVLDEHQFGFRGTLLFKPVDGTELRLRAYAVDRQNDWGHSENPISKLGPGSAPGELLEANIAGPTNSTINTSASGIYTFYTKTYGVSLQWDQKLGDFDLTSITAYQDWYWRQNLDNLATTPDPYPLYVYVNPKDMTKQWSEELRIASPIGGRIDYQAGVYLYNLRAANTYSTLVDTDPSLDPATVLYFKGETFVDTYSYAGFGQGNFHVNDAVTLIAGARWTDEKKELYASGDPALPGTTGVALSAPPGTVRDSITARNWSYRLGVQWKATPDSMLYATLSHGHKGPAFNSLNLDTTATPQKVKPELSTNFEVGAKAAWFNHRLTADVDVFHTIFTDYQADVTTPIIAGGVPVVFSGLANAGKVRTQGVDLEVGAVPADGLNLRLTGSYVDAKYVKFLDTGCYYNAYLPPTQIPSSCRLVDGQAVQDLSGTRLPYVPKLSGTLTADYELKLANLPYNGFARVDYSWRSSVQYSTVNSPDSIEGAYGLLGASIGVHDKSDHYTFTVFGKNLTNKFHVAGSIDSAGPGNTVSQLLGPDFKRIWGARLDYTF